MSSLSLSVVATAFISVLTGAGFWAGLAPRLKDQAILDHVRKLERKERSEASFRTADTNQDGDVTVKGIEYLLDGGATSVAGIGLGKQWIYGFLAVDVLVIAAAGLGSARRAAPPPNMHGKGSLQVKLHCAKHLFAASPATTGASPAKLQPVISVMFDTEKVLCTTPSETYLYPQADPVFGTELKKPLDIDFDFVNTSAKGKDPASVRFPKRWFHVEVANKTEYGSEILGECEVDVAALLQRGEMTVHLGQVAERWRHNEIQISSVWTPDLAPSAQVAK